MELLTNLSSAENFVSLERWTDRQTHSQQEAVTEYAATCVRLSSTCTKFAPRVRLFLQGPHASTSLAPADLPIDQMSAAVRQQFRPSTIASGFGFKCFAIADLRECEDRKHSVLNIIRSCGGSR